MAAASASTSADSAAVFDAANAATRACKFAVALPLWIRLMNEFPDNFKHKMSVAFVYEQTGKYQDAMELIEATERLAIERKYDHYAGILLPKARVLAKMGRTAEAVLTIDHAIRIAPGYSNARSLRDKIISGGQKASVKSQHRRSRTRSRSCSPRRRARRQSRSRSRSRTRSRSRSRSHSRPRHSRDRDARPAKTAVPPNRYLKQLFETAKVQMDAGAYGPADQTLTQIIELIPRPEARDFLNRSFVREHLKDYEKRSCLRRASVYSKTGKTEKAGELLTQILALAPKYAPALELRAKLHANVTTKPGAEEKFEKKRSFDGQPVAPPRLLAAKREPVAMASAGGQSIAMTAETELVAASIFSGAAMSVPTPASPPIATSPVSGGATVDAVAAAVPAAAAATTATAADAKSTPPLSTWDVQTVADWFASVGTRYHSYSQLVKENGLSGEVLSEIVAGGELVIRSSLHELGITNGVHQKVLISELVKLRR